MFIPKLGSKADNELHEIADRLLAEACPDEASRAVLVQKHREFWTEVTADWRKVNYFKNTADLREKAITTVGRWRENLQRAEAGAGVQPDAVTEHGVTDKEFGRLGRWAHRDAVLTALAAVERHPGVPAAALLLSGDEDAGQKQFLDFLLCEKRFRRGRSPWRGRPPGDGYDLDVLLQWMAVACGRAGGDYTVESINALAEIIHSGLKKQELVVVLDQIYRFVGGVARFQAILRQPLVAQLTALCAADRAAGRTPHRLIVIAADYTGAVKKNNPAVCAFSKAFAARDYNKLLLLPALTPFEDIDVRRWLDELGVPDEPEGRREELVRTALYDPQGRINGTPRRVFERLRDVTLRSDEGPD